MAFRGLRWLAGGAVSAAALVGACGYPDFTYGPGGTGGSGPGTSTTTTTTSSTGGGQGGSGGVMSTVSSTASSTASSGGGGSGPVAHVECGGEDNSVACDPGQLCCVNLGDTTCDKCFDSSTCEDQRAECADNGYAVYECDNDDDCPTKSSHCCAQIVSGNLVQQVRCYADPCSDASNTRQMCHGDGECPASHSSCMDFSYPPYKVCE